IAACGGLTTEDGVRALEAYARLAATQEGLVRLSDGSRAPQNKDAQLAQGVELARGDTDDGALGSAGVKDMAMLSRREPKVARAMEVPLFAWSARAARLHVVSRLVDQSLDEWLLRMALSQRNHLKQCCGEELRLLLLNGGVGAGRAAAVLEDAQ